MASKITYEDKEVFQNDPSIPDNQKVKADNMNEIKSTVNTNADTLDNTVKRVEELEKGGGVTITVGETTTGEAGTEAAVENSGTSTNAIFNFTIPRGDKGEPGKDGKDGKGVNILGSYDSLEELKQAHPTGNLGDAYLIQGELYVWSQTESNWISGGNIQGPTGPQGEPGPANTLKIGTVASGTTASATISGSSPNQTLNLVLPKGDKGDTGPQGEPGKQGEQGEPGPAGTFSEDEKTNLLKLIFPIGSLYTTQTNQNPNLVLGFGTWERFKGRIAIGIDEDDTDKYFNELGKTGGEKKHKLTKEEMPENRVRTTTGVSGGATDGFIMSGDYNPNGNYNFGGNGKALNVIQPYEVVGYMWIRRA